MADVDLDGLAPCPELDISAYADSFDRADLIVDVTRSFLRSATEAGQTHVILVSSAMVYGAWPNNPVPISEREPVRPVPSFMFAVSCATAEALVDEPRGSLKKLALSMQNTPVGSDGLMHPNRILSALRDVVDENSIFIADGGDFLSFARVGLPASTYLDPGSLGCIGVGTPLGVAASLVCPEKTVVVATGDGSFGFNAMELDTAVRHNAPVLVVIANNGAWAIEVRDQIESYGTVVGTQLRFSDYAAMAKGLGLYAERVERAEDLPGAIARAMANRPALLDVLVTPEAVSSDAKSGLAWVPDLQALGTWDEAERQWRNGESSQR
ncbi:MAG: hypothetical protein EBS48_03200 [Actinobacteria bacterium]|nr:hypothetical protein [Actinomycetota bacterium]